MFVPVHDSDVCDSGCYLGVWFSVMDARVVGGAGVPDGVVENDGSIGTA